MENNVELQLARQVVENTGTHLFLTGKAGTGKTTFLRQLKENTPKRMVVVAPTGIAAINAGGVTMHSFFQLPFAPYVPDTTFASTQSQHKFSQEKIHIIRTLDLLVIDEISMVRADMLDAIDSILRRFRDHYTPFGGVQLLMIGDLQQLAPVVKDDEWRLLSPHYDTPFFFGSRSLVEAKYATIELKQIYRQSDLAFIQILNRIRDNKADENVLQELNKRYIPHFQPKEEEGYIRLTTHNSQAQLYNDRQLSLLPEHEYCFEAKVEGAFPETTYPADKQLTVKKGAQIMFIKNDSSPEHRFYNGKIGIVTGLTASGIWVRPNGDEDDFLLETEEWTNSKYILNPESKEITEEVEGRFRQYPIRLAWAITIHKSQGLTFERAIIDANASFAHGQVYVALSRCKSLEGLVLGSPLHSESIISDNTIDEFTRNAVAKPLDEKQLKHMEQHYFHELLCEQFNFSYLEQLLAHLYRLLDEHFYQIYPRLLTHYKEALEEYQTKVIKVADTFKIQYSGLIMASEECANNEQLHERIASGAHYFLEQLDTIVFPLMDVVKVQTDNKEIKKKITSMLNELREVVYVKNGTLLYVKNEGFSVASYLRQKAFLMLASSKLNKPKRAAKSQTTVSDKIDIPLDVFHPELYRQIVLWRNAEAAKSKAPVYTIIQQKAIMGIVNQLPSNLDELTRISYFGKLGAKRHGKALLELIDRYVAENDIDRPSAPEVTEDSLAPKPQATPKAPADKRKPRKDTKLVTYELYKQGLSIEEIAKARELVTGTIAGHLCHYVNTGEVLIEQLVDASQIDIITEYFRQNGNQESLTTMKAALGDAVSYADIKLVLAAQNK